MKPILIVQNITREGPGLISAVLNKRQIRFEIANLDQGQAIPDLQNYSGLIVLGGPDSANDTTPKMLNELTKVKECLNLGLPYLGICLGLQVLVKVAGGKVVKNKIKEIGFRDPKSDFFKVELTKTGINDPLLTGLPESFPILQLHGETVDLIPEMTLLATGQYCRNQIVKVSEKVYGIQGHIEPDEELFNRWCDQDPDLLGLDRSQLKTDHNLLKKEMTKNGMQFIENFLKIIK